MKQFVLDYTAVHNSTLDLCFSTHDTVISILWCKGAKCLLHPFIGI